MRIGSVEVGEVFLAPIAGITDYSFRVICKEYGADLVYTELISGKGILNNKKTWELLKTSIEEKPISLQLFGSRVEVLVEAVKKVEHLPFDIIDINMGCPVPKVVKNGDGVALMNEPKKIGKIIYNLKRATKKPITIKIRKGFNEDNAVEVAKIAEESGVDAIAVHGRTREQFYSGKADWDIIKKVKESVLVPVIGNGDIVDGKTALKIIDETNCDGIMIGRGAMGNPFIFSEVKHYLKNKESISYSLEDKINVCLMHSEMMIKEKKDKGIIEMRKHLCCYTKGLKGAKELRHKLQQVTTYDEIEETLRGLQ